MYIFNRTGLHITRFVNSISLFFVLLGHLSHSLKDITFGRESIAWFRVVRILFYSGVVLVIPLIIICSLIAISLSLNAFSILAPFSLQNKALPISQDILTQDILPLLIGVVLCVQSSLNIINARLKITKLCRTPHEVIHEYIMPIMIGINLTGLLLFTYTIVAVFISLFFTFHYLLDVSTHDFLIHVGHSVTIAALFYSVVKTLLYCSIVSFTAGYYYYHVAVNQISLRKAVSRIFTRGSLWLTLLSVYWKLMRF
ncbi:MAG: ABC transporter permease [Legionella sp.]|nr:ABC transporter permease [Legionella sp.]